MKKANEVNKVSEREFVKIRLSGLETKQEVYFREVLSKVADNSPTLAFKRIINQAMEVKKLQASEQNPKVIPIPTCGWAEHDPQLGLICYRYLSKGRMPSVGAVLSCRIEDEHTCDRCKLRDQKHEEDKALKHVKVSKATKKALTQELLYPLKVARKEIEVTQKKLNTEEELISKKKEIIAENIDCILRNIDNQRLKGKLIKQLTDLQNLYL